MCTVSVITGEHHYLLGMNRDEKLARGAARGPEDAPSPSHEGTVRLLCPRDVEEGTWVGVNEHGNSFALLNWNDVPSAQQRRLKSRSRGFVIPHAAQFRAAEQVQSAWTPELLAGMLPFRLIGVFPAGRHIVEWRWNMREIEPLDFMWKSGDWTPRHWFSSGMSDELALKKRGEACRQAWQEEAAGSAKWLRRLHSSHANGPGPFSICVHRDDVRTLSYTEIRYDGTEDARASRAKLTYFPTGRCEPSPAMESFL